jgi:hypothetical protein
VPMSYTSIPKLNALKKKKKGKEKKERKLIKSTVKLKGNCFGGFLI